MLTIGPCTDAVVSTTIRFVANRAPWNVALLTTIPVPAGTALPCDCAPPAPPSPPATTTSAALLGSQPLVSHPFPALFLTAQITAPLIKNVPEAYSVPWPL